MSKLKDQIKGFKLSNTKKRDVDPEDDLYHNPPDSDSSDESDDNEEAGREHYESVGESRLRKPEQVHLDPKYDGAVVSRSSLSKDDDEIDPLAPVEDEQDEDPFAEPIRLEERGSPQTEEISEELMNNEDDDEEIDSDEAFGDSDAEKFKKFVFRGSKTGESHDKSSEFDRDGDVESEDDMLSQESSDTGLALDVSNSAGSTDSEQLDGTESSDMDDEEEEDQAELSARSVTSLTRPDSRREELKALLSGERATVTFSLSQAASADAHKGNAVKQQNQTFDRLLDARIKLQKGLMASYELQTTPTTGLHEEGEMALKNAEDAALKLFSTIESLRNTMLAAASSGSDTISKKRKRPSSRTSETAITSMWSVLTDIESQSLSSRRTVLDKWSNKIRASDPSHAASTAKSKFLNSSDAKHQSRLSAVLETYLLGEQARLYTAATRDGNSSDSSASIPAYDDGTFYQSLLRDLINSRASGSGSSSNPANLSIPAVPLKLHPSGNKARQKIVDTRASKGRKVRYTVHEKLQNFMAAEGDSSRDTAQWTEAAKREFFGSLMGQSRALDEDVNDEMSDMEAGEDRVNGDQREVEALRLFRSQ